MVGDVFPQVTLPWDSRFCLIFNDNSLSLFCQFTLGCEGLLICLEVTLRHVYCEDKQKWEIVTI